MPLDHTATAELLEEIATTKVKIAIKTQNLAAQKKANEIKTHLLGLADWHLEKAKDQKKQENIFMLSELQNAGERTLLKIN